MLTVDQVFDVAVQHHRRGRLPQAEQFYRQILQVDPRHARALHFLGLIAHQVGRADLAIEFIGQAVRLRPDYAEAHSNLGMVLAGHEKMDGGSGQFQAGDSP